MKKYLYIFFSVLSTNIALVKAQVIDTVQIYAQNTAYQTMPNAGSTYNWWVEDGIITAGQGTAIIYVNWLDKTGLKKIQYTETAQGNCTLDPVLAYVLVNEKDTAFMPNAFSPNADGLNDSYKPITNWNAVENYQLSVYNRWGNLIFDTHEIGRGWDGNSANLGAKTEVFVFVTFIQFKSGKQYFHHGNFTLLN